jgi:predicted HAD superfamily Cof-like phosphohydrolase
MTNFTMVADFMKAAEQDVHTTPTWPEDSIRLLRYKLIDEELTELHEGMVNEDVIEIADALTDLLYVIYGAGHAYGIDLDRCFAEVHRSNMSKFVDGKRIKNADGKVMKPPTYSPPDLSFLLPEMTDLPLTEG